MVFLCTQSNGNDNRDVNNNNCNNKSNKNISHNSNHREVRKGTLNHETPNPNREAKKETRCRLVRIVSSVMIVHVVITLVKIVKP